MSHGTNQDLRAKLLLEKFQCYSIIFLILPGYYWFAIGIGLPKLLKLSFISSFTYPFHAIFGTYSFINVAGNLLLCVLTDSRLKDYDGPGTFCEHCKQNQPADTWHCTACNACIIRRDHHCCILSTCIGRKNIRYFICMLGHLTFSMPYCMYYSSLVIFTQFDIYTFINTTLILLKPDFMISIPDPPDIEDIIFVLVWFIDLLLLPSSMFFLFVHMRNAVRGLSAYEYFQRKAPNETHWTSNLEYVFGTKWYLAMLWPFVRSTLPEKRG